jgi:uroporphyrinogen-III synthase
MAGTRSSARNTDNGSSPAKSEDAAAGSKRKPETEPSPKRSHKAPKKQATLEESGITKDEDSEMKDGSESDHADEKAHNSEENAEAKDEDRDAEDDTKETTASNKHSPSDDATKTDTGKDDAKVEDGSTAGAKTTNGDNPVQESSQRKSEMPSNILEKGLIYFFTRNRVGIDDADSVGDLQRTFFVLRPLPTAAKLGDGAIPDMKNNRLFALPKKTFPKSHNDRFMAFVEKANTTIQDLKDNFCMFYV